MLGASTAASDEYGQCPFQRCRYSFLDGSCDPLWSGCSDTGPGKPETATISHVAGMLTTDFVTFTELFWISGHAQGWTGMCSPNFTPLNESFWIMTFNSWGDEAGKPNQLFYLTSADINGWIATGGRHEDSDPPYHPLGASVTRGVRSIDAAVWPAKLPNGTTSWLLAYKRVQTPFFALGPMSGAGQPGAAGLEGDFDPLPSLSFSRRDGTLDLADHENWDFLEGPDGKLRVVSSDYGSTVSGARTTWLYTQETAGDFGTWNDGYPINVTRAWFNNDDLANAGFVADWRGVSGVGQFVLIFAGNTQKSHGQFAGRGHNRLGFAVSGDLEVWDTLPASSAPLIR